METKPVNNQVSMEYDEVNTAICQELTLLKLELLQDFDINYRPRI